MGFHAKPSMLHLHLHLISQANDYWFMMTMSLTGSLWFHWHNYWTGFWLSWAQDETPLEQFHHRLLPSCRKCDSGGERAWKGGKERWTSSLYWLASRLSQMWFQAKKHARAEETHCYPYLIFKRLILICDIHHPKTFLRKVVWGF